MSVLSESIKYYRKLNGFTQAELAKHLNVKPTAVSAWELGRNKPLMDKVEMMSQLFNISKSELLGETQNDHSILSIYNQLHHPRQQNVYHYAKEQLDEQNEQKNEIHLDDYRVNEDSPDYPNGVPLPGDVAAGKGLAYADTSYDRVSENVPKGADVALTVRGDSMEPLIEDGSIIFFKSQPIVENGEIAIVEINNQEVTCKKFYKEENKIILKSINEKYDDMIFEDVPVRVLGKVLL